MGTFISGSISSDVLRGTPTSKEFKFCSPEEGNKGCGVVLGITKAEMHSANLTFHVPGLRLCRVSVFSQRLKQSGER